MRDGEFTVKKYIVGRVLFVIPIMFVLSIFTFGLTYLSPSDPVTLFYQSMGTKPDKEMVEKKKEEMGLNDPFLVQYGRWVGNVLHGDLGESYRYKTSVWSEMGKRLPNTLVLTGATVFLTILFAVPLGILCAAFQNSWMDYLFRLVSFLGVSMPSFWVGTLLMYAFGVKLHNGKRRSGTPDSACCDPGLLDDFPLYQKAEGKCPGGDE